MNSRSCQIKNPLQITKFKFKITLAVINNLLLHNLEELEEVKIKTTITIALSHLILIIISLALERKFQLKVAYLIN